MYQRLVIIGHLGNDPELRYTPQGVAVANFSVATREVWKDASGEKHEETTWFRCAAWNKLAETVSQYLHKGSKVFVEGTVKSRAYTDREGNPAASLEVRVDSVRFLDNKKEQSNSNDDDEPSWT